MDFVELINWANSEGCSDVHITVGTAIAIRKFGKLEMIEPVPSAAESEEMILSGLTDMQYARV